VIALGVVGALGVGIATLLDPMGLRANVWRGGGWPGSPGPSDPETASSIMRTDDILYAGGVLLIGAAVLLAFACAV